MIKFSNEHNLILEIESDFDKNIFNSNEYERSWSQICPLIVEFNKSNWKIVLEISEKIFAEEKVPCKKAFIIQWAISASEMIYDLNIREKWMKRYLQDSTILLDWYGNYLFNYHLGIKAFYNSMLEDAHSKLLQALTIATQYSYVRGIMRVNFHLGLVFRDKLIKQSSIECFEISFGIAKSLEYTKMCNRIYSELEKLDVIKVFNNLESPHLTSFGDSKFDLLIKQNKWDVLRKKVLAIEVYRRKNKISKQKYSLATYMFLYNLSQNKYNLSKIFFRKISDPILQMKVLRIKQQKFILTTNEKVLLDRLTESLTYLCKSPVPDEDFQNIKIGNIQLSKLKKDDMRKLLELLLKSLNPISKEEIVKGVWGFNYNPIQHDYKVYKLIHRVKKTFNMKDIILNKYGSYILNFRLLSLKIINE